MPAVGGRSAPLRATPCSQSAPRRSPPITALPMPLQQLLARSYGLGTPGVLGKHGVQLWIPEADGPLDFDSATLPSRLS